MNEYKITLIGLNLTIANVPMQPDEHWAAAAKAAIELGHAIIDPADYSYMSVEEVVESSLDPRWRKMVGLTYKKDIDTATKLFELLKQVDAEVTLDILLSPAEGLSETQVAGLLQRCKIETFGIEKLIGEWTGILHLEFGQILSTKAVQLFAVEVGKAANTEVN